MLTDEVTIIIKAGDGGNGAVSFHRNAQTAKGGPNGGNGGNGGNVYVQGSHNVSDLRQFRFTKRIEAANGVPGKSKNLFGRNAEDLYINLPFGTKITETKTGKTYEVLDETPILIAQGGVGGRGNNEFKSATNQAPQYAEKGSKGEEKEVYFELHLIADIGLIGLPNAGKSSLLGMLTNATPKIGAYPFTTLEPNLGVLGDVVLADIPGLIEGASDGKGLGIKFLKHIEKTKLLVHCIDSSDPDPLTTYQTVRKEFEAYKAELLEKPELILLTKIDLIDEKIIKERIKQLKKTKRDVYTVSVYDEESLKKLSEFLQQEVKKLD